jgi:hypothetical protein
MGLASHKNVSTNCFVNTITRGRPIASATSTLGPNS